MILRAILTAGTSFALLMRRPAEAEVGPLDPSPLPLLSTGPADDLERHLQSTIELETPATCVRSDECERGARDERRETLIGVSLPDLETDQRPKTGDALQAVRELFDGDWYLDANADVAKARVDPFEHFVAYGIRERRAPNLEVSLKGPIRITPTPRETLFDRYLAAVVSLRKGEIKPCLERGNLHLFSDGSVERGLGRFARFPLFDAKDYLALNPPLQEIRDLDVHHHAFTHGFSEGRSIFDRCKIANELGLRSRATADTETTDGASETTRKLAVSILCNTSGNSFLQDIAECLVFDLRADGHDAMLLDDTNHPSELGEHTIIVAPHEFFFVGRGGQWIRDDVVSRGVMFNTEQPQTVWFDRAVPFNLMSKGVIDMSPQVASIYAESVPATDCHLAGAPLEDRLPDPTDPVFRVLPKAARTLGHRESRCEDRCIDVSFFGGISQHRERFFAQTARFFSDYKTFFYCRRDGSPLRRGAVDMLSAARRVAFHSKIVLNVHRDEFGFFEWHRIVRLGIEAGALVVSEPCLPHTTFKPNVHYFEESGRHIQNLIEWLLKTPDGQVEYHAVKQRALDAVDRRRAERTVGRRVACFLDGLEAGRQ